RAKTKRLGKSRLAKIFPRKIPAVQPLPISYLETNKLFFDDPIFLLHLPRPIFKNRAATVRERLVRTTDKAETMDRIRRALAKGTLVLAIAVLTLTCAHADPPPLPVPSGVILNTWVFNDTNHVIAKRTFPRGAYGVELVPSWQSNAVSIPGPTALLQYNEIDTNGVTNIVCDNGTVTFWFSPEWDSG